MKCDICESGAKLVCSCRRCSREADSERFWSCSKHQQEAATKHHRIRGREPVWVACEADDVTASREAQAMLETERREPLLRQRWGSRNGGVWIDDPLDRTNYLLDEIARIEEARVLAVLGEREACRLAAAGQAPGVPSDTPDLYRRGQRRGALDAAEVIGRRGQQGSTEENGVSYMSYLGAIAHVRGWLAELDSETRLRVMHALTNDLIELREAEDLEYKRKARAELAAILCEARGM